MPLEFSAEDFDAYAEGRARVTALTAPRAAVKKRLVDWMRAVAETLAAEGTDLEVSSSDEHPSARNGHRVDAQSVFLYRAASPRPHVEEDGEHGHARVELRVDASAVTLLLRLGGDARADLEHAVAMLSLAPEEVLLAWEDLPDAVAVEARGALSSRARPVRELGTRDAAQLAKQALESEVPVVMGVRAERGAAGAVVEWRESALALGRLLSVLAWSAEAEAWIAARMSERPSRRSKRAAPRPPPPPEPSKPEAVTIDRGAHVRALAGPFAGQAGVVQELDGKGGARVLFGLLAARVELRDLVVKGKERGRRGPLLSSSHRKP